MTPVIGWLAWAILVLALMQTADTDAGRVGALLLVVACSLNGLSALRRANIEGRGP